MTTAPYVPVFLLEDLRSIKLPVERGQDLLSATLAAQLYKARASQGAEVVTLRGALPAARKRRKQLKHFLARVRRELRAPLTALMIFWMFGVGDDLKRRCLENPIPARDMAKPSTAPRPAEQLPTANDDLSERRPVINVER
jgi:signal transduction histidine kinase